MILSPRVEFSASHDRHEVYLGRRTSKKRWHRRGAPTTLVELGWRL
jgi:hypothetical protein